MGPARAAVLRNVLIERMGQVTNAIDVSPRKVVGQMGRLHVRVRQGRRVVVVDGIAANLPSRSSSSSSDAQKANIYEKVCGWCEKGGAISVVCWQTLDRPPVRRRHDAAGHHKSYVHHRVAAQRSSVTRRRRRYRRTLISLR